MNALSRAQPAPSDRVDVAHGLSGWQDLVRQRFVALDIRPGDDLLMCGQVSMHGIGPLAVASVRSVGQTFRRTAKLIDRHGEDRLQVALMCRGVAHLEQDGRSAQLRPGSLVVYDTTRPFTWTMPGPWQMNVFTWSRDDVPVDTRRLPSLTARPVQEGASGTVARAALRQLAALPGSVDGPEGVELAGRVCELVVTAVAHQAPTGEHASVTGALREVVDYIELHLTDPQLSPAGVAHGCHVSLRTLHRLFADQPRTASQWIRFRRLDRARAELVARPERPIAVVAAQLCFSDATVFARAFREEYALSPRDFRMAHRVDSLAHNALLRA